MATKAQMKKDKEEDKKMTVKQLKGDIKEDKKLLASKIAKKKGK